jgi:hypothetical protein
MLGQFTILAEKYITEVEAYASKPTKASSKRLRDLINQMQKLAVATKKHLIELDKGV